jgi:outer membrane protein assembly factor BamB
MVSRCLLLGAMLAVSSLPAGADDWPQFRGPGRDNRVTGFTAPATWPKELKKVWQVPVGEGLASPALVGDKLYVFTRVGGDEVLTCLDAKSGKEVWKEKYASEPVKGVAGGFPGGPKFTGTRSSPAVAEGKVCTFSVAGRVTCFDAATGKVAWFKETNAKPQFYTSTSPLITDGKCILHIGSTSFGKGGGGGVSKGDLVAYDLANGEEKWKWSGDGPGYGSPVLATIHGVKQVVEQTNENLIGVSLQDGNLLWKTPLPPPGPRGYPTGTPIIDGNKVICLGTAFSIEKTGDKFAAKQLWKERPPAQYNTPVLKENVLYGLADAGGGGKGGGKGGGRGGQKATTLFARDAATGAELWAEKTPRGECGAVLDAGSVMILLSSDSNLVAFKPDKEEFKELAKYKVAESPTWAMPIINGKRIYVKDEDSVILWSLE